MAEPGSEPATQGQTSAQLAAKLRVLAQLAAGHRQTAIAKELGLCEAVMRASAMLGRVGATDRQELDHATNRLAQVVREVRQRETTPPAGAVTTAVRSVTVGGVDGTGRGHLGEVPPTVLVVGSKALASWLRAGSSSAPRDDEGGRAGLDVESSEDASCALGLVHALAPDVVVIDVDLSGARELVPALTADPATQDTPIIAIGPWQSPEQASALLEQGVARVLCKPVSPSALRRACYELAANPAVPVFTPIGRATVEQLADRLARELQHGLSDALDEEGRQREVDLGPGVDVLAALWGAVARIRELVAAKSEGRVRFVPTGPEGAVPTAAWFTATSSWSGGSERGSHRQPSAAPLEGKVLAGRTIIVAEDDLSVNWFLSGVLRQAGARVLEARDGTQALSLALQSPPDLIVSDILMPGLDGFAVSRAVRRDVVLRDVPVVLLSWKEDLLQRARELDVGAEGYLRKEESGVAVVRHLAELLQARSRVAARIATDGAVHGRLDGLSAYSLLHLVCLHRPDCRVTVRDAFSLYEVEIRRGRPVAASRVTAGGDGERGAGVLQVLLGVSVGRFGVVDANEVVDEQLGGTLSDQLVAPLALARAAQSLLIGPALLDVARVEFDRARVAALLDVTPDPAGSLLRALAAGASPNELLSSGRASASLLESVLSDAIRHGAIRSVVDRSDAERLAPTVIREQEVLRGRANPQTLRSSLDAAVRAAYHFEADLASAGASPEGLEATVGGESAEPAVVAAVAVHRFRASKGDGGSDEAAPAVGSVVSHPAESALQSARGATGEGRRAGTAKTTPILSSGLRVAPVVAVEPVERELESLQAEPARLAPAATSIDDVGRDTSVVEPVVKPTSEPVVAAPPVASRLPVAPADEPGHAAIEPEPAAESVGMPSTYAPTARRTRRSKDRSQPKRSRLLVHVLIAVAGVSLAIGARWLRERPAAGQPDAPSAVAAPQLPAPAATATAQAVEDDNSNLGAPAAPAAEQSSDNAEAATPGAQEDLPMEFDLGKGEEVAAGEGILEIVAGKNDQIYVNGKLLGKGPVIKVTLKATSEPYEVRVKLRGEERVRYTLVKESKRVRLRVAPPWKR